ncbi:hypothetical protein D9611_007367 [Ephemerocybe angulata]|uniref:Uncharacterized protein n=1 Tax=Ephemerocybe angulata TaxID=980116 RepID=A0A8H5CF39_9AGAR|nr:hypothetical protein D9611_007367 [Tulosesus angulatus]
MSDPTFGRGIGRSTEESQKAQGNMPGEYDSTSSGGYGSAENVWSQKAQRGFDNTQQPLAGEDAKERERFKEGEVGLGRDGRQGADGRGNETGLVDQATDGTELKGQMEDARGEGGL